MYYESENIEFKQNYVDDIYKEVIAFANTEGGTIYIGVTDRGEPVGLENLDDTYTRITNGIRDAILPDVTIFVKYTLEKNQIIRIEVGEGAYKPYYLKSKGLKPSGVYVRQGASSVPASPEQIRQMIKIADGNIFENLRSINQELSFSYAAQIFVRQKIEFNQEKYYILGITSSESDLYTNLGYLISDQCEYTIKVAVFSDQRNTVFRDRKEFGGSVFLQAEETYAYLNLCNQNRSVIDGLEREDYWDYPKEAVREALLNALIHRDYNFNGSIIINVNEKEMEFISIGGLTGGLSPEDIRNGISLSRNNRLAEIFHRLHFIEAYGTGIRRIFSLYENCSLQPEIIVTPNTFKIVLPNMNFARHQDTNEPKQDQILSPQMQKVLDYLSEYGEISEKKLQELLNIKRTRAYTLTRQMAEKGLIQISGRGADKKYYQ